MFTLDLERETHTTHYYAVQSRHSTLDSFEAFSKGLNFVAALNNVNRAGLRRIKTSQLNEAERKRIVVVCRLEIEIDLRPQRGQFRKDHLSISDCFRNPIATLSG